MKNLKFSALVRLYENEVYSLALYLLTDPAEAEDMAQEAYIRLWENLGQVEFSRARHWLMRVTRNACLDRLRRRSLEREFMDRAEAADTVRGPMETLASEQSTLLLRRAVNSLDEPFRSLVTLRDIHQYSYRDIAAILELSLDQVKVYLYRARQQLKQKLEEIS